MPAKKKSKSPAAKKKAAPKKAAAKKTSAKKTPSKSKATATKKSAAKKPPKAEARAEAAPEVEAPKKAAKAIPAERYDELRFILVEKREAVIRSTQEEVRKYISGENRQLVESALDEGDWSVMDLSEDLRLQKLGTNHDTIIKIDQALEKLDSGTYGICEDCGDEISAERLRILPFAIRCRDCQEDHEELLAAERGESIVY